MIIEPQTAKRHGLGTKNRGILMDGSAEGLFTDNPNAGIHI